MKLNPWIRFAVLAVFMAALVCGTLLYMQHLLHSLEEEEHRKVELWAEATRQFILADENTDVTFIAQVIEDNTTIPVFVTDREGHYLLSRNVDIPERLIGTSQEESWLQSEVDKLRQTQQPITVHLSRRQIQYIYHGESRLLRSLQLYPYIELGIVIVFLIVFLLTFSLTHQSQEDKVWVGLSKETAHQLGTPISALNAWSALLKANYPDDTLLPEMDKDIARLQVIAERFQKVGSHPTLSPTPIRPLLEQTISYMQGRMSQHVQISLTDNLQTDNLQTDNLQTYKLLNPTLFSWVIENLIKNAVDAGSTDIRLTLQGGRITITDNGKGMTRAQQRKAFQPGYTTKQRGWGLGLSLARRIIHDYHHGTIAITSSLTSTPTGTTFTITLPNA